MHRCLIPALSCWSWTTTRSLRQSLIDVCATVGIRAMGAASADEALQLHTIHHPAVVVCDFRLPDGTGIDLAGELKIRDPEVPVLLLTGLRLARQCHRRRWGSSTPI